MAVGAQPAGRLRQHRQQRRLGVRELPRRLAEVGPARRLDALDVAAEGREREVQGEDLVLGQAPFELQGARDLAQLAGRRARHRFDQARDLHRQRGAARHDAAVPRGLPRGAQQRQRIDPGMLAEAPVLVTDQGLQVQGRYSVARTG